MPRFLSIFLGVVTALMFLFSAPAAAQVGQADINAGLCTGANLEVTPTSTGCGGSADVELNNLIRRIINILSIVVGLVAVVMIIVGGFRYITSGGSDTSVTSAKNTILYAIIGLIIVALAQILVRFTLSKVTYGY